MLEKCYYYSEKACLLFLLQYIFLITVIVLVQYLLFEVYVFGIGRNIFFPLTDLCIVAGKTRTKDKYRVVYSDNQRFELETEFCSSKYITIRRKAELAAKLQLSERQVSFTFNDYLILIDSFNDVIQNCKYSNNQVSSNGNYS